MEKYTMPIVTKRVRVAILVSAKIDRKPKKKNTQRMTFHNELRLIHHEDIIIIYIHLKTKPQKYMNEKWQN